MTISYLYLSSRVNKLCIRRKSFQELPKKQDCENAPDHLHDLCFTWNVNEPNGKNSKQIWKQQKSPGIRHSQELDTIFPTRGTFHNYNIQDSWRMSSASQTSGCLETIRDNLHSHNSPNRRICQPFCDLKNLQDAAKTKAWTIFCISRTRTLRDLTRRHTSTSCMLVLIYKTLELNIKCLWQHPATINNLEISKTEWSEMSDTIVIKIQGLRQLQPETWKFAIKHGTEELTELISALQEYEIFPHIKNTSILWADTYSKNSINSAHLRSLTTRRWA